MSQQNTIGNELRSIADLPLTFKICLAGMLVLSAVCVVVLISSFTSVKIDQGFATLVGAIVGLCVVAWQTNRGFANLVRSQRNEADLDRQAREHQHALNISAVQDEHAHDREVLISALLGGTFLSARAG